MTTHFIVDARCLYKSGHDHIKACISNPSGATTDAYITDKGDGTYRVEYTPYEDGEDCDIITSKTQSLSIVDDIETFVELMISGGLKSSYHEEIKSYQR